MIQKLELIAKQKNLDLIKFSRIFYSSKNLYIILNKNKFSKYLEKIIDNFEKRIDFELYINTVIGFINKKLEKNGKCITKDIINTIEKYSLTRITRGSYIIPGIPKSYVIIIKKLINSSKTLNGHAKEFAEKVAYILVELTKAFEILKISYLIPTVGSIINMISVFPNIPRDPWKFITTPYHLNVLYGIIGEDKPYYLTDMEKILLKDLS